MCGAACTKHLDTALRHPQQGQFGTLLLCISLRNNAQNDKKAIVSGARAAVTGVGGGGCFQTVCEQSGSNGHTGIIFIAVLVADISPVTLHNRSSSLHMHIYTHTDIDTHTPHTTGIQSAPFEQCQGSSAPLRASPTHTIPPIQACRPNAINSKTAATNIYQQIGAEGAHGGGCNLLPGSEDTPSKLKPLRNQHSFKAGCILVTYLQRDSRSTRR